MWYLFAHGKGDRPLIPLYYIISCTQCSPYMLRCNSEHSAVPSPALFWSQCHSAICEIGLHLQTQANRDLSSLMCFAYCKLVKWVLISHWVCSLKNEMKLFTFHDWNQIVSEMLPYKCIDIFPLYRWIDNLRM